MTYSATSRVKLMVWIGIFVLVALSLLVILGSSVLNAAVLVDQIPGGDAGLATTPELESAYSTMRWSFLALVATIAIGVSVPLFSHLRRRTRSGS